MTAPNVNSPFRVIICFLVIAIAGWIASFRLSVDLLPEQSATVFTISFSQANTSPDILEQQSTSLIENACSQLGQLKQIRSVSSYNSGSVQLEFDRHTDMALKRLELTALIRQIYPLLPSSVSYPVISRSKGNNETAQSLLQSYTIRAPFQPYEIKENAETVFGKAFAGVPGIQELRISGTEQMQVNISFDKEKCEALKIAPAAIINAIHASFSPSYPGAIQSSNGEEYFLQLAVSDASIDQLNNIVLPASGNSCIRIKDIARVYMAPREPDIYFRINGRNALTLNIYGKPGENKIILGKLCRQVVQRASAQLPSGYHVSLSYDAMSFLEKEIRKNYIRAGLSITILLFFLLVSYRNGRYLLNLFAALLLSISITFLLAWIFGITLHLYTLAGLAISFGIITDNAIVMLDHYHRFRNRKIATALLGAALTTIAALLLVALPDFSMIVILALVSSLISTIWFMPEFYKLTLVSAPRRRVRGVTGGTTRYYTAIRSMARYRGLFIVLIILSFGLPVFLLPNKWEGKHWYNKLYNITLGNAAYQEHAREYVDKWLGGSLRLFVNKLHETSGYRSHEQTKLLVEAELPYGHTPGQMNDILSGFEQYLGTVKGIDKYITSVYSGQKGNIEITFKEGLHDPALPHLLKERLVAHSMSWGGVAWNIWGIGQGFSNTSQDEVPHYRVMLKGYNYDELERQAAVLAAKLGKYRRVQKININEKVSDNDEQSEAYTLRLNKAYLALYGAHLFEVLNKVSELSVPAGPAAQLTLNHRYYPLVLKEQNAAEYSRYKLLNDPIVLDSNRIIRLREAGSLELESAINSIYKENRQYIRMLSFDYMGPSQSGIQHLTGILQEMNTEMPAGYSAEPVYMRSGWGAAGSKYGLIAILFLLIFFICGILFEQLKQSFFIICIIPISFIGLFLVCSLGNFYWDQGGYAAFIMLGGLVSNAGIFVINDFNRFRNRCNSPRRYNSLLILTLRYRSRTILLTTIATCCSLIPFLVEGHNEPFWFPLAVCITGGLPFLLLAVFFVLPVFLWKREK